MDVVQVLWRVTLTSTLISVHFPLGEAKRANADDDDCRHANNRVKGEPAISHAAQDKGAYFLFGPLVQSKAW